MTGSTALAPIHGTALAFGQRGVLLRGPPGAGKSDLGLRLLDRNWSLVSDDYVLPRRVGDQLLLAPPPTIAGLLEVRGVGLVRRPYRGDIALRLVVDLDGAPPERLPRPATVQLFGLDFPCLRLDPFEASACLKLESALTGLAVTL